MAAPSSTPPPKLVPSVLLVVGDAVLRDLLLDALRGDGYAATAVAPGPGLAAQVAARQPNALVLDLGGRGEHLPLLDALRNVPETSRTAIVTLVLNAQLQEKAKASGNVYTSLEMPFDLQDLLEAVEAAVANRPAEARLLAQPLEQDYVYHRAADVLTHAERDIVLRWVQLARSRPPFAGRPDISPADFLDALPRILNLVILALRHQQALDALGSYAETRARIEHHAADRLRQGLEIAGVPLEFQLLREVIHDRLRREMDPKDIVAMLSKLHALLDDVVRISVSHYHRLALTAPIEPARPLPSSQEPAGNGSA